MKNKCTDWDTIGSSLQSNHTCLLTPHLWTAQLDPCALAGLASVGLGSKENGKIGNTNTWKGSEYISKWTVNLRFR